MTRRTVLDLINDAFLGLDGDDTAVLEDSKAFSTGLRLLNQVIYDVYRFYNWSFLRESFSSYAGDTELPHNIMDVIRVFTSDGNVLKRQYNNLHLDHNMAYYIWQNTLTTGLLPTYCQSIEVEYMPYPPVYKKGKEHIHPKFYDILRSGLTAKLAGLDDGYRDTKAEHIDAYTDALATAANRDKMQAGNGVIF